MEAVFDRRKITIGYWFTRLLLVFLAGAGILPFILALYLSLRNNIEVSVNFWGIPEALYWENYKTAFEGIFMPIVRSLLISGISIALLLTLSSAMAYVFARMQFAGKEFIFTMYLVVMMIPSVMTIAPVFMMVSSFHLLNSWWAIILPYAAFWQVMGIFIMRNNYKSIPEALFEAARVEGAGDFYCFLKIAIPLNIPIMITVAITTLLAFYNDYMWPVLVLNGENQLFAVFIKQLGGGYGNASDIGVTCAAYVLGSIPLVAITGSCLKHFVQGGLLVGGIKE